MIKSCLQHPALTQTLPAYQTACGATDIMAHVCERYFTNTKNVETTDRLCEAVLLAMINETPKVIKNPDDYDAGLVTRASAVIPIIPLYLSVLFKVMKKMGTHEGCIEQINRLFAERLYIKNENGDAAIPTDEEKRIRIDDLELDPKVQEEVNKIMPAVTAENIRELGDVEGYRHDFLATSGFDIPGVDYEKEVERFDVI